MSTSVFDYDDYQAYLANRFAPSGESRGGRSKLAQTLRCQNSFVSQVLSGKSHLSLEHALLTSQFLDHSEEESRFFMLLVVKGKAGSKSLEKFYEGQIREIREKRQQIRERIQVSHELKGEDQMTYYSAWYYLAIHILVALPPFQTKEALCRHLHLPPAKVGEVLDFLHSRGLVIEKSGRYGIGVARIHLGHGSPMLARHHANWRMKAIEAVDHADQDDLHYSGVIGISAEDGNKLKSLLLSFIEKTEGVVRESKEDTAFCLLLDLFRV